MENEYEKISEEEVDEMIENIERKAEEARLNEAALKRVRWNDKDKESYKRPDGMDY